MDYKTKCTVKSAIVMYHLGYKWANNGETKWTLYDSNGSEVYSVSKECFPPRGDSAMDFVKKSMLLLPDVTNSNDFSIIFGIHKGMANIYDGRYTGNVGPLDTFENSSDFSNSVIDASLLCIFGE